MKWTTFKEYEMVNTETGEITLHGRQPKKTEIIGTITNHKIHENKGIKTIKYLCRPKRQLELEL